MRVSFILVAILLMSGSSCKETQPTSDSTPPVIKWKVINTATNKSQSFEGNQTINVSYGGNYQIICKAEDPEGIHKIGLKRDSHHCCEQLAIYGKEEAVSCPQGSQTPPPPTQVLNRDSNGNVLTSVPIIDTVSLSFQCDSKSILRPGAFNSRTCTGENYFGGVTKGKFVFKVGN